MTPLRAAALLVARRRGRRSKRTIPSIGHYRPAGSDGRRDIWQPSANRTEPAIMRTVDSADAAHIGNAVRLALTG